VKWNTDSAYQAQYWIVGSHCKNCSVKSVVDVGLDNAYLFIVIIYIHLCVFVYLYVCHFVYLYTYAFLQFATIHEGHHINKLQNGITLLILKI